MYLVGDASRVGFSSLSWKEGTDKAHAGFRNWMEDVTKGKSSNFWEAGSLVIRLKQMVASGELERGADIRLYR
jgi:hypothetical protein